MYHNYKELKVWQKSRLLVKDLYELSLQFPSDEKFGLTSQLRRAAVSISLNISEGTGRSSDKDFVNFLHHALGSCYEVENILILCADLKLVGADPVEAMLLRTTEIQRMLNGLIDSLNSKF